MSPLPLSEFPPQSGKLSANVSLVINLHAEPSARLTHEISVVLNSQFDSPYRFLGSIGNAFYLQLRLDDIGQTATEALARRLLKLKGVKKLEAQRRHPSRGAIYAISLRSQQYASDPAVP